jgi:hypothetical protein
MKKSILIYLLLVIMTNCKTINYISNIDDKIVLKIEIKDNYFKQHNTLAYILLNAELLDSIKNLNDSGENLPALLYSLTKQGGVYISNSSNNLYTFSCCEYGDISEGVKKWYYKEIDTNKYYMIEKKEKEILNFFDDRYGIKLKYNENNFYYKITSWSSSLDYCSCDLYMETPPQKIYNMKSAYLKNVFVVKKPNSNNQKKIKRIFDDFFAPK